VPPLLKVPGYATDGKDIKRSVKSLILDEIRSEKGVYNWEASLTLQAGV